MFDKFYSLFNNDKKRRTQLSKVIIDISLKLKEQQDRLDEAMRRLRDRDKELYEKVVRAQIEGDVAKATIYAQEISDIRKIIKIIYTAYLAIEKVRIKLDTVKELQGVSLVLLPIMKVLNQLKDQIRGVSPEVAMALDSITSSVNSIAIETGVLSEKSVVPTVIDEEAQKILNETKKMAESKLKELLPELPYPPSEAPRREVLEVKVEQKQKRKISENELLDYIKQTGGFLDVDHFSKLYNVEKDEVLNLLKTLAEKGLVSLEG